MSTHILTQQHAAIANKACPWGPYIPFYTGRVDNPTPAPKGQLPPPTFDAATLIPIFATRGFSAEDLVAMVGAHSVGTNLSHVPFDTTPGALDSTTYFTEVLLGNAPTILPSDHSLAFYPETTYDWQEYARDQKA